MNTLSEAICFATAAFDGMVRKVEHRPAILHSLEAAVIASTVTDETEAVIAAVLHDTVEDAGVSLSEIEVRFGARVAELVAAESENKREDQNPEDTWMIRKQEALDALKSSRDRGLKAMYLGDKLSNMRSLYRGFCTTGDELWTHFHQKDPAAHKWYYCTIAECLIEYRDTAAYAEYVDLIRKIFGDIG